MIDYLIEGQVVSSNFEPYAVYQRKWPINLNNFGIRRKILMLSQNGSNVKVIDKQHLTCDIDLHFIVQEF
jgi:hypothetical protein